MATPVRSTVKTFQRPVGTPKRRLDAIERQKAARAVSIASRRFAMPAKELLEEVEKSGLTGLLGSGRSEAGQFRVLSNVERESGKALEAASKKTDAYVRGMSIREGFEIPTNITKTKENVSGFIEKIINIVFLKEGDVTYPFVVYMKNLYGERIPVAEVFSEKPFVKYEIDGYLFSPVSMGGGKIYNINTDGLLLKYYVDTAEDGTSEVMVSYADTDEDL
jgi:hypothetical protein